MAKLSQRTKMYLSIGLSAVFMYLTIYKPSLSAWLSGRIGIGEAFFGYPRFNVAELGTVLRSTQWGQISIAGVIFFGSLVVRAWRWQLILNPLVRMNFWQVFGVMNIGYMANNVLPLRLGEVYKAQVIYQLSGLSRTEAFGTIVVERLVDLIYMVPFIGLAIMLYPMPEAFQIGGIIASVGAFALCGFCVWLGVDHDRAMHWTRKVLSVLPESAAEKSGNGIDKFTSGLGVLGRRELFWGLTISSIILWIMYGLMVYLVLDSLGMIAGVPLIESNLIGAVLVILFITTFGFVVPGAPGAVGTYHGVAVLGLSLFKVPGDQAVGFALLLHALNYIPLTALGWAYFWKYGLSFRKSSEAGAVIAEENQSITPAQ
ncbi:flippase-like domain-containing protein [bacterium]|nr:flippase-like domain-containing protein [bacterium]MBU1636694.1 flippase-like domain-containing protein [bacterium]MBU1920956.1 flippase-like domain-containing protein [bacterium]